MLAHADTHSLQRWSIFLGLEPGDEGEQGEAQTEQGAGAPWLLVMPQHASLPILLCSRADERSARIHKVRRAVPFSSRAPSPRASPTPNGNPVARLLVGEIASWIVLRLCLPAGPVSARVCEDRLYSFRLRALRCCRPYL